MESTFTEEVPRSLTNDEQIYLLEQLKLGNKEVREKLIVSNLGLVKYEANRICCSYVDIDDRIASGVIGLIKAIATFDLSRGNKFSSYAVQCIDNEIFLLLRKERKENERRSISLDDIIMNGETDRKIRYEEIIEDEKADFISTYLEDEERETIRRLVFSLPEKEKIIIMLYFGFDGERYNQKQIAEIFGISQSYISRKIVAILDKLKLELKKEYSNKVFRKTIEKGFN